ncbi:efflux RND transporter periplasmic adaptor subunit [Halomonas sp. MCCC 1A11036]|uniref:Efflux RND transporter periplasmic adaptor subunit n=1 Tax=Billgrantia zhangzhouensis TaxID=2733481 RepID=A0ABS9AIM4_9GAMM|nr:efflux RND transporter periplasmic adaptor subunit [Halomonas zhangzhouensis]MCE8021569.1 efflux RND transporter periplasmic adaptor subunit [Halomonas zhangzhouensis]
MNVHKMFEKRDSRRTLMVIAMVAGLVVLTGCESQADTQAGAEQGPPPPQVSVAQVLVEDVELWDAFTGRIEAVETVDLRPRVSGYIESVNYSEGQEVGKGDVLFVIDQRPYRAELERAEAELQRARARAELARSEAARAEALSQTRSISREELDQRRAAAATAEADTLAAQAIAETARLNMEFTEVRAPIAGRTGRALVTPGNLVSEATPLTRVVALDRVHVHFHSDEQAYLRYEAMSRNGERAEFRGSSLPVRVGLANDEGYPYRGEVDFVDNRLDAEAGTILTRAVLDNSEGRFAPGMYARVQLLAGSAEDTLLIDDKAVLTDQDRKYVYVVDEEGRAMRRDVQLGRMVGGLRVVTAGLEPSDQVVVSGAQRIFFPGMPVAAESVDMRGSGGAAGEYAAMR